MKKWTEDLVKEEILKYDSLSLFKKNSSGAYKAAVRFGILEQIVSKLRVRKRWTNEMIFEIAKKYDSISKFRYEEPKAFQISRYRKIYEDVTRHMTRANGTSFCEIAVFKYVEFLGLNPLHRHKIKNIEFDVFVPSLNCAIEFDGDYWHKNSEKKHLKKELFAKEIGLSVLRIKESDWKKERIFCLKQLCFFLNKEYCENNNFLKIYPDIDYSKYTKTWNKKLLMEESLKYKTLGEFQKKNPSAYNTARNMGIFEEITSHMPKTFRWNENLAGLAAEKYSNIKEFQKNNYGAYFFLYKNGLLDKYFVRKTSKVSKKFNKVSL